MPVEAITAAKGWERSVPVTSWHMAGTGLDATGRVSLHAAHRPRLRLRLRQHDLPDSGPQGPADLAGQLRLDLPQLAAEVAHAPELDQARHQFVTEVSSQV